MIMYGLAGITGTVVKMPALTLMLTHLGSTSIPGTS